MMPNGKSKIEGSISSKPISPTLSKWMEARIGIEPMHKDFADPRLTAWLPRLSTQNFAGIL